MMSQAGVVAPRELAVPTARNEASPPCWIILPLSGLSQCGGPPSVGCWPKGRSAIIARSRAAATGDPEATGRTETKAGITNKLSRATMSAHFFLAGLLSWRNSNKYRRHLIRGKLSSYKF
jgi:hypothetical protein